MDQDICRIRELAMEGEAIHDEKMCNDGRLVGISYSASELGDIVCIVSMNGDPLDVYRAQRAEFLELIESDQPVEEEAVNKFRLYSSMRGWEEASRDIEERLLNFEHLTRKEMEKEWESIKQDWSNYGVADTASREAMYIFLEEHGLIGKHETFG